MDNNFNLMKLHIIWSSQQSLPNRYPSSRLSTLRDPKKFQPVAKEAQH